MQYSIFVSRAIDAEIQTVWGRKLRFDPTLGRVRPVWDYALKGAKTQRAKRERGEYNRTPVVKKKKRDENDGGADVDHNSRNDKTKDREAARERSEKGAHPGQGDSKSYLKDSVLSKAARSTLGQGTSEIIDDASGEQFEPEDTIEVRRPVELASVADVEPAKKKQKVKQERESEFSDSEHYSD